MASTTISTRPKGFTCAGSDRCLRECNSGGLEGVAIALIRQNHYFIGSSIGIVRIEVVSILPVVVIDLRVMGPGNDVDDPMSCRSSTCGADVIPEDT